MNSRRLELFLKILRKVLIGKMLDFIDEDEVKTLSPLVTAYIGDAYFHLYVRTRLLTVTRRINNLHDLSAEIVSATAQATAYAKIEFQLTDKEREIFRRGKNAKSHAPRSSSIAEYHISTGFESLLGELYLKKNFERLNEICDLAFNALNKN
ncbi:MAG: ribonuclease III [Selenomonadaceae bacterium]|nr:ribonuclease III [Selenomonadaceae bacterium]